MDSTVVQRQLRRAALRHPQLLDLLLGVLLVGPPLVATASHGDRHLAGPVAPAGVAAAVLACLAITFRRVWPMPVLLATAVATLAFTVTSGPQPPVPMIALVIAVYTVASRLERRRTWLIAAAIALSLYLATVLTSAGSWWAPQNIGVLAWIGMATAVGDATGSRRAYVTAVEERARRAEQTREDEARRRVVEERMRIARELHDVVSHHIAVINVQAGAARHVLHRQPGAADSALEHIRHASDTVMRELSSIVGVLRDPGDAPGSTEPARGLARLTALLDTVAVAGLRIEHRQHGEARELPAVVDLAAYRILQEALTNAHKHGTGSACLTVTYAPDKVVLEVDNPTGPDRPGSGYGLLGMRERASAAGGTLTARHEPTGRFRVRAELPAAKTRPQP
nr:histidine kinase [Dactylosporangium thailandense]